MTERKTGKGLTIYRRLDASNVPAPWVPPELPASTAAPGRAVAKRDRANSLPAPWVPAELPASTAAPAVAKDDRVVAKLKPWVPPAEAPRNLPATVPEDEDRLPVEPQKRKKRDKKQRPGELTQPQTQPTSETVQAGQTIINIVNQVAAPAPVVYVPWICGRWNCHLRAAIPAGASSAGGGEKHGGGASW